MEPADVDWVPGAFSIVRRDLLARIGDFDEAFFLYYEEVDLCRRIRAAGLRIRYWPDVVVVHIGGESSRTHGDLDMSAAGKGAQLTLWRMRSGLLYYRKHHGWLGAWTVRQLEANWHRMRAWRNRDDDPQRRAKRAESSAIVALLDRAWRETAGGRRSPPRPW
jgi:GT2 family glycosyltransferase